MASAKVKGVVIGGVNVKDKDKIVYVFTLEKGVMSLSMRGVRSEKAKLKWAKEPFCFGEFIIEENKNFNIVTGVDVIDNFFAITNDLDKFYEGSALLDVISKVVVEANPPIFIELIKALKTLCYDNVKKYYVIDKFLLFIFKSMGYGFLTEDCSSCGSQMTKKYLNLEVGELVCSSCKNAFSRPISDVCYGAMRLLENTDYEKLSTVNLRNMAEVQAFNLLSENYQFRTGYKLIDIL